MKKYLFVMRRAPNVGSHVQEALDMMLTTAAFDQSVAVLFVDDGVLQLKKNQNPVALAMKDTSAVFGALEIYDIHALFAESESLQTRGLDTGDLILPVKPINRSEIPALLSQHDVIVPD